ncbi:hypothetical protein GG344DRAFT_70111 [Lentinula edodes]|nr:hypothetical protein GG344DRAFT_70111 [Lentinula edodes]
MDSPTLKEEVLVRTKWQSKVIQHGNGREVDRCTLDIPAYAARLLYCTELHKVARNCAELCGTAWDWRRRGYSTSSVPRTTHRGMVLTGFVKGSQFDITIMITGRGDHLIHKYLFNFNRSREVRRIRSIMHFVDGFLLHLVNKYISHAEEEKFPP